MNEIHIPIDGILDLHMFSPGDAGSVVEEYLSVCHEKGILDRRVDRYLAFHSGNNAICGNDRS